MTTPMIAERFADRFRYYRDQPQQQSGVLQLFEAISSTERGEEILCDQAPGHSLILRSHQHKQSRSPLLVA